MSDVVVSVVESNTAVTVTEQDVAVDVTENNVVVSVSTAGIQGVPGANNDPTYVTVRNATGATLAKGTIVYISGANGNNVQVSKAIATGDSTSARTIGWLAASIPNNGSGLCMVEGYLEGINTQGFTAGAQLYLSGTVAGGFTATKPQAPTHLVYVGVVTKVSAGDGHVFVKVQNGYELGELHDVLIVSPTNNQVLAYDSATQLWKNATNAPDGVTSITATAPLTGGTITSTGSIGLNQALLSITKSQVSDFTSGTVTSASTAQQAGTAVYSVNSGTAVYATTSGTAVSISGTITKSQVSDFTSGTVASAGTSQQSGTAVFANTSGTATYATTSGTATYADTSGTAVFATNASTAVTISGSIAQSQVTNLTTDLAGKANLAGGNALTGTQTITSTASGEFPLSIVSASGQTANLFRIRNSANNADLMSIDSSGQIRTSSILNPNSFNNSRIRVLDAGLTIDTGIAGNVGLTVLNTNASPTGDIFRATGTVGNFQITSSGGVRSAINVANSFGGGTSANNILAVRANIATNVPLIVQGAASQSVNILEIQNSANTVLVRADQFGGLFSTYAAFTSDSATTLPLRVRGAANQVEDLTEWQNSSATVLGGVNANAQIFTGSTAPIQTAVGAGINGVSGNGTLVTFSTTNAHNLSNGDRVTISGLTPTGYNGTYIISGVSTFSFNVTNATTGTATGSGIVSVDAQASVVARSAGTRGVIVRGASGQAVNLLEFQDNSSNVIASVNGAGLISSVRQISVNQSNAGETMMFVRGAASQTGDSFAVRDNSANTISGFSATGRIYSGVSGTGQTFLGGLTLGSGSVASQLGIVAGSATTVGAVIRGAASQSANLQEWQDSAGTIQSRVTPGGSIVSTQGFAVLGGASISGSIASLFQSASAARIPLAVQGAASQSANLQEWQNSAGTVLARVESTGAAMFGNGNMSVSSVGSIFANTVNTNVGRIGMSEANSGGQLTVTRQTAAATNPGANIARLYFRDGTNAGTLKLVVRAGAAGAETTILDNIPQ